MAFGSTWGDSAQQQIRRSARCRISGESVSTAALKLHGVEVPRAMHPRQTATCPPRRRIRNPSIAPAPSFLYRFRSALTHRAALVLTAGGSLGDGPPGRAVATLDLCGPPL